MKYIMKRKKLKYFWHMRVADNWASKILSLLTTLH